MLFLILAVSLPLASGLLGVIGTPQSIAVRGQLTCNGVPAQSVKVKLYDVNTLVPDSFMAEEFSDSQGAFQLQGKVTDITTMDPKFNIYHQCNYQGPCYQKVPFVVPKKFNTVGSTPELVYDVGVIELAQHMDDQSQDCLN